MEQLPQRGSVPQIGVFHTPRLCNTTGQVPDIRLPPHVACQGATSRRDRRLRFAMIWRVMTVAPPMAAATAKPATPERTMARCPTTTPRKPDSMAVIAKPVIEKNPAFRSRHSHLVYPFIVSLQLVRDARDIAVGRLARSYETLGNPGIPPFLPSRPLLAAFSGMRVGLSFFIFVPVAMPSTGRTGRSRIRVPNHSRQQSGMGLRRPGDRPASADGSQSRPALAARLLRRPGYAWGSTTLPSASRPRW